MLCALNFKTTEGLPVEDDISDNIDDISEDDISENEDDISDNIHRITEIQVPSRTCGPVLPTTPFGSFTVEPRGLVTSDSTNGSTVGPLPPMDISAIFMGRGCRAR